jgi:hypothetical protein
MPSRCRRTEGSSPAGTPDLSFGDRGSVFTTITGGDEIHALALQPDGKILAAGASSGNVSVARYWP